MDIKRRLTIGGKCPAVKEDLLLQSEEVAHYIFSNK